MELDLQVLGPLRLLVDGRVVELGPSRRRTLLAALALEPGRLVPLDTLADRVWDGEPPSNPAAAIHAYVSRLRASMRPTGRDGSAPPAPLVTQAPGYRLDIAPSAVDAHRFATQIAQARSLHATDQDESASAVVRAALASWRGEAYLDVPAEFARREADRLADLRGSATELAVQVDLALGRHADLVPEVVALIEADPLREGLRAALMLALYRDGRQAEALQVFAEVREVLTEELGIDPGPAIRQLHEQILRQEPELELRRAPSPGPLTTGTAPVPASEPAPAPLAEARMIGRDAEWGRLAGLLDLDDHQVTAVVLVGEAGIGKSRMAEEAALRAGAAGRPVAWGRCWPHEGAPVLWPWVQALQSLIDQSPEARVAAALAGPAARVATLLPQLTELIDADPAEVADGSTVRLYGGVATFLRRLTADRPALVVLEDLHWADPASAELVEYLLTQAPEARLTLLTTVRDREDRGVGAAGGLLATCARSRHAHRIDLGGLSVAAVTDYVADRTGSLLDSATSLALTDRTGGNPFYVGELVRLLVGEPGDDAPPVLPDAVPESVREVVSRRLEQLPAECLDVLRVAAVVGPTFELDLLERVCGLDADRVDEAVDRATDLGVTRSDQDGPGRHRFVHALTQQTLLDTTGPARLRRLHGRLADELASGADTTDPLTAERLAYHLALTGGRAELARAAETCVDAAPRALVQGNHAEAEALLRRTLELAGRAGDPAAVADRVVAGAMALAARGDGERAVAVLRAQLDALPPTAPTSLLGAVRLALADALTLTADAEDALGLAEEAAVTLPPEGTPQRARALVVLARVLLARYQWDRVRDVTAEALDLADRLGLEDVAVEATTLASTLRRGQDEQLLRDELRAAIDRAERSGAVAAELRARYELGRSFQDRGRLEEAEQWFASAVVSAVRAGVPWSQDGFESRWQLGWVRLARGAPDQALATATLDRADEATIPDVPRAMLAVQRATIRHGTGEGEDAELTRDLVALRPLWTREALVAVHAAPLEMTLAAARGDAAGVVAVYEDVVAEVGRQWREWFDAQLRLAATAAAGLADVLATLPVPERAPWLPVVERLRSDGEQVLALNRDPELPWLDEGRAWAARLDAETSRARWLASGEPGHPPADLLVAWRETEAAFAELGHGPDLATVRSTLAALGGGGA